MLPVTIFNASPLAVQISINNGASFSIQGTHAPNFTPQTPSAGGPTWGSTTAAAQNVIAFGPNELSITPQGVLAPYITQLDVPAVPWISLQIYIFFNAYSGVSWILLNNGQFVAGAIIPATYALGGAPGDLGAAQQTI
jgi:hypothetical protein